MQPHLVRDFPAIAMAGVARLRGCGRGWAGWARRARALGRSSSSTPSGVLAAARKLNGCGASEWAKRRGRDLRATQSSTASGRSSNASAAAQNRTHRNNVCANLNVALRHEHEEARLARSCDASAAADATCILLGGDIGACREHRDHMLCARWRATRPPPSDRILVFAG